MKRWRFSLSHALVFIAALTLGMFLCSLAPLSTAATSATAASAAAGGAAAALEQAPATPDNVQYCDDTYGFRWLERVRTEGAWPFCGGSMFTSAVYESPLAMLDLRNVMFDYGRITAPRPETRVEADEYFGLQPSAVRVVCADDALPHQVPPLGWDDKTKSLLALLSAMTVESGDFESVCREAGALVIEAPTLLVQRFEYANMYHQLTDWFNSELALHLLGLDDVRVEFFDGHQKSPLDDVWKYAFDASEGGVPAANHALLPDLHARLRHGGASAVCYRRLVFPSPGYASRLLVNSDQSDMCKQPSPLHAQLRRRVLRAFGVADAVATPKRCVAIVRRDYMSHPRNWQGVITRKFADEGVIGRAAAAVGIECELVDLAQIAVAEQVRLVADASILLGVHGAGLSLAFLLPPAATLIEARMGANCHFENIAAHAGVRYIGIYAGGFKDDQTVSVSEEELTGALRAAIEN